MVYEWTAEDYAFLRPLKQAADILSTHQWPTTLYNSKTLANISMKVPIACLVSYDDIYVERTYSEETAALLGDGCKLWITNEHQHSGLADDPSVFDKLLN